MSTAYDVGTHTCNYISGLPSFVDNHVPGHTVYASQVAWEGSWIYPPAPSTPPSWVQQGTSPTWQFLYNTLSNGAALNIELCNTGTGGEHFVSVTGISWDDTTNSGTLTIMNPSGGAVDTFGIRQNGYDIDTDYWGPNASWISADLSMTPIPEPTTMILLLCGAIPVVWCFVRRPRRRTACDGPRLRV
jgi:hypothetical protein